MTNKKSNAPIDETQAIKLLEKLSPGWQIDQTDAMQLWRDFQLEDFSEAIKFINKIAIIASAQNHHPDLLLHDYRQVTVSLTTHSVGGLTELDFNLAEQISEIWQGSD
jgi:4a-hydroxytetrahydrobiopterin dehydratase